MDDSRLMTLLSDAMFAAEMKGMLDGTGIDLGYAATLPSKEAVAYFRAKGAHISWNWFETNADVHARSFTAAKWHAWTY